MTPLRLLRNAAVTLMVGAFALSACGGAPSAAPSTATAATAGPTAAATPPAATAGPTTAASAPAATGGTAVDPAEDLEIAAPYSFRPLDPNLAAFFISTMEASLGAMADVFDVGVREAIQNGQPAAYVIVMRFPNLPIGTEALLDGAAEGAAGSGGTVENQTIGGEPVRIVAVQGQTFLLTLVGDDLVMVIAPTGTKKDAVDVTTAIISAN